MQTIEYTAVVGEVLDWYRGQRDAQIRIKVTSSKADQLITQSAQATALTLLPGINVETLSIRAGNCFVIDGSVDLFPQSPFSRLHTGLQHLRRGILAEILERGEILKGIPKDLQEQMNPAWQQVCGLPPVTPPQLGPETIKNLLNVQKYLDRLSWEKFMLGLVTRETLLKRTLAARFRFSDSIGLGYSQASLKLSDQILNMLDVVASCTPWRLDSDLPGYKKAVNEISNLPIREERFRAYLRVGGMWSDEMVGDAYYCAWLEALETGIEPAQKRPAIV